MKRLGVFKLKEDKRTEEEKQGQVCKGCYKDQEEETDLNCSKKNLYRNFQWVCISISKGNNTINDLERLRSLCHEKNGIIDPTF